MKNGLFIFFLLCTQLLLPQTKSLYEEGLEKLAEGDTSSAEDLFEESAEEENSAPAYYELAKISINNNSWFSMDNARGYLQEAIELDTTNLEYRLMLGEVYERIEDSGWFTQIIRLNTNPRDKAVETYQELLKIDSSYNPARIRLANLFEEDYYKNVNSMSFIQYEHPDYRYDDNSVMHENAASTAYNEFLNSQVIDGHQPAIYYTALAKEFFDKAAVNYLAAIKSNGENEEAYFKFSLLLCTNELQDSSVNVAEEGLEKYPESLNLALAAGYLNYKVKNYSRAKKYFELGFSLMTNEELRDYKINSVFSLLTPEENSAVENMNDKALENYINIFWKKRDPLTVTDYNERELEHYARFFYVNHYFSIPEKNIKGWQTDRGDIWLRYGEPQKLINIKRDAEVNGLNVSNEGAATLTKYPEAYVMKYADGRTFSFIDEFNSEEFVHSEKAMAGRLGMQFFSDSKDLSEDLRKSEPEEYFLKVKANILDIPSSITQVRNNIDKNSTMLFVSYAMPIREDTTGYIPIEHVHDISLMDNSFHTLSRNKDTVNYAGITTLNWFDGKKYVFSASGLPANPGAGFLSFEILRPEDNGIYINHGRFIVKDFSQKKLNMSDVVVAYDVLTSEAHTASIKRGDLYILPNPLNTFNKDRPPFIYYEIYNLKQNPNNLTDFEQDITIIEKPDDSFVSSAWNSVLSIVGVDTENKVSLKSNYNTPEADPQIYVQLDLNDYDPGEYIVTIKVKDKITGEEISSSVEIVWQ